MQTALHTKTKILQAILQIRSYPFTSHDLIAIKQKVHRISLKELTVRHIKHIFLEFVRVRKFRNSEMQFVLEELLNVVGLFDELDVVGECVIELLYENDRHVYDVLRAHFAVLYEIMERYGENVEDSVVQRFSEGMDGLGVQVRSAVDDTTNVSGGSADHGRLNRAQPCLSHRTGKKIFYELFIALSHFKNKQLVFFLRPKFVSLVGKKPLKQLYLQHKMYVVVPECLNLEVPTERALFALNHKDLASFVYATVFDPYLFQINPAQDIFYESVFFLFLYFDCEPMMEDLGMQMFGRMVGENEIVGMVEHVEQEEKCGENASSHIKHCCERLMRYDARAKDVVRQKFARFNASADVLDFDNKHLILRSFPLNKRSIGKFLSNNSPVLKEYLKTFDFANLDLLGALRTFLKNFYLPTESQAINKILSAFSERYYECNKDEFGSDGKDLDDIVCGDGADVKCVNGIVGDGGAGGEESNEDELTEGGGSEAEHDRRNGGVADSKGRRTRNKKHGDKKMEGGNVGRDAQNGEKPGVLTNEVQGVYEIADQKNIGDLMNNSKMHAAKDTAKTGTKSTAFDFDSVDILTFCILCLNTDLHNVAIRVKTLKLSFIDRARKCNLSYFFTDRYLSYVYDSVRRDPLVTDSHFIHNLETYRAYYQMINHSSFCTIERMNVCLPCKRAIIRNMCAQSQERVFKMAPDDVIRIIRFGGDAMAMIAYCVWYGDRIRRERVDSFFRIFYAGLEMIEADDSWDARNWQDGENPYVFLKYPLTILNKYKGKNENFFFKRSREADKMKTTLYKVIGSSRDAVFRHFIEENAACNLNVLVRKNVFRLDILDENVLGMVISEETLNTAKELEMYDLFYRMLNLRDFTDYILRNDWIEVDRVERKWINKDVIIRREEIGEDMFCYLNGNVNLLVYFGKCKSVFNLEWLEHIVKDGQKCYMERINVKDDRLMFMVGVLDCLINYERCTGEDTNNGGTEGKNDGNDTMVNSIPISNAGPVADVEQRHDAVNPYEYLINQMASRLDKDERTVLVKNIKKIIALLSLSLPLIVKIVKLPVSDALGKELAKVFMKRIKYKNVCASECEHKIDVDGVVEYIRAKGWESVDKEASELTSEATKVSVEDVGMSKGQNENELDI
ncbi:hypothetical protein VCUG_00194 [Vavraia culicis subsp. floridensis]|uniref:SEC7 domain-containing protein n=1 Tax=Vavraia culicis (isolate floridensis) TaxID=948595 RepID=L2GYL3_VAVCU|nr:uncharacterized protein VCUG_00194 [Vavraia culicis subsp. floridensis]ELA48358.1 hypothetical protein VCUG_00194 [Vavraia culicis subsp. floridensis]